MHLCYRELSLQYQHAYRSALVEDVDPRVQGEGLDAVLPDLRTGGEGGGGEGGRGGMARGEVVRREGGGEERCGEGRGGEGGR